MMERYGMWANGGIVQADPRPSGMWVRYDDAQRAVAEAEQRGRDEQRARDYVILWSRLMLEDRKYRDALARAALVLRGRWTDRDILAMTGTVVSLHEWETVKPVPDAYEQGQRDERAKHVNDNCLWGQGQCVPGCPSCKRMDDLYAERAAGAADERARIRAGVEELANKVAYPWASLSDAPAVIDAGGE